MAAAMVAAFSCFALGESISGVVTNKTTNKPAAGDDVVLIRLQQGMQEASRTKMDSHGRFTLAVPDSGIHLGELLSAGAFGTRLVEIDVYNAAAKIKGVAGEADVMRIQTDASGARVSLDGERTFRVLCSCQGITDYIG